MYDNIMTSLFRAKIKMRAWHFAPKMRVCSFLGVLRRSWARLKDLVEYFTMI